MKTPRIIRFPTSAVLVEAQPRTLRERIRADLRHMYEAVRALFRPRKPKVGKAPVFRVNNPAQWKLERARRKARGNL